MKNISILLLTMGLSVSLAHGDSVNLFDLLSDDASRKSKASQRDDSQRKPIRIERTPVLTRVVTNVVEKVVTVEKPVEKIVTVEKPVEKVVTVEKLTVVTNVIEKVKEVKVADREVEEQLRKANLELRKEIEQLRKDNLQMESSGGQYETRLTTLTEANDELKRQLAIEKDKNARLQRVVSPETVKALSGRPAKITSNDTYYDRKEGFAVFKGKVHVDDEQYQMHANKAYVFFDGTNQLRRLVAMGNVAITNGAKRASGVKASYYKPSGMIVLYGDATANAVVLDESKVQDQTVIGSKIKFWVNSEQVEVIDAKLSAPAQGVGLSPSMLK